jgi:cell division protein FtsI/penicillin-binding protein 2
MAVLRRLNLLLLFFFCSFLIITGRLFYWQVLASEKIKDIAWNQYRSEDLVYPFRGDILASDRFPLAATKATFLLFASLPELEEPEDKIAEKITPIILPSLKEYQDATKSADKEKTEKDLASALEEKLKNKDVVWIGLQHNLSAEQKEKIEVLNIKGLGFEPEQQRFYPEASMAAHLLGFVGKDKNAYDQGYFGLEGFYDLEIKGRPGVVSQEKDAGNKPILFGSFFSQEKQDGNTLVLYLDRVIQFMVEDKLKKALGRFGAKSGHVTIMDPKTGGIIAMASFPGYDPRYYFNYLQSDYKNPVVADVYEPGSTFKVFVMAAGLDAEKIEKESRCDICTGPYKIDKYYIRTWDDKYHENSSMTDIIKHSNNVGMVFVGQKLGVDNLWEYLDSFGFGRKTNIDLQEEISSNLKPKNKWSQVDLATASFGQGIAVTGIQMVRAAAAIANGGELLEPHMVKTIISGDKEVEIKPEVVKRAVSQKTAQTITQMMVEAVEEGEAKWTKLKGYKIAGKTGTAQIPIAGHYDKEKTIASFIGFAPANRPKFVMLVTLREPTSSPWASETAAPLFFDIAEELFLYYGIQPD